ncbi:velvet factor-domain-containing protein [Gamsiella multidivaricata]|uniref:velvet factor-domain-containing protein n=1 Tax=Gamsiella multidivaricata TaxID=101098 RepID=UPI00222060BD|nr:velvet factor-domain-containing protein [Gamsiella multidivaricata]KAI7818357.1 velvet factor-domain-containing protein [Gamsiella multidivaricata]
MTEHNPQDTTARHIDERPARIKIVQQPLHARMCGFGEKDRRPIDPPPIVQLLLDEDHEQHPSKRVQRSAIAAAAAKKNAAGATTSSKQKRKGPSDDGEDSHDDNEDEDEAYQLEDDDEDENGIKSSSTNATAATATAGTRSGVRATRGGAGSLKQEHDTTLTASSPSLGKRGRPAGRQGSNKHKRSNSADHDDEDDENALSDHSNPGSDAEDEDGYGGQLQEQDPLFVLHVSLWSADGKEVRNMIATPGQSEPPKLTRILMGSLVVSPILLNSPEGVPGWYFSFPDLSIRTEGVYTLKFSLMRFGSFDFMNNDDGHASGLVAEETSDPFTVFSAKKFPGMTESTELSKAFAKQGLKIPIRNDLRARKADRD